jgi:hypothetical protein
MEGCKQATAYLSVEVLFLPMLNDEVGRGSTGHRRNRQRYQGAHPVARDETVFGCEERSARCPFLSRIITCGVGLRRGRAG